MDLLQYGGLGLAALVIGLWAKYVFNHEAHTMGVIERNAKAMEELTNSIESNTSTLKELLKDIIFNRNK